MSDANITQCSFAETTILQHFCGRDNTSIKKYRLSCCYVMLRTKYSRYVLITCSHFFSFLLLKNLMRSATRHKSFVENEKTSFKSKNIFQMNNERASIKTSHCDANESNRQLCIHTPIWQIRYNFLITSSLEKAEFHCETTRTNERTTDIFALSRSVNLPSENNSVNACYCVTANAK